MGLKGAGGDWRRRRPSSSLTRASCGRGDRGFTARSNGALRGSRAISVTTEVSEIIFRPWGEIVPRGCLANHTWQVELHQGLGFPLGIAWVLAPPAPPEGKRRPRGAPKPFLKYIL